MVVSRFLGWVDPGSGWHGGWFGHFADEAFRVCLVGAGEDLLSGGVDGVCLAVMDLIGCHQANAGMMVVLIVPGEEVAAEGFGVLDTAEALGKLRLILECLEVGFRERVVV